MRRSFFRSMSVAVLAASVPVLILAAQAKPNVKLGLWESITTMEGGQPGTPQKICITAEKLATGAFDSAPDQECKRTVTGSTASSMDVKEACASKDNPGMTGNGTLHIQVIDPQNVKGTLATTLSMGGRSMQMNGTFTSKWVSADCGAIK